LCLRHGAFCRRRLGGAADHLIDGNEKRICRLSFVFWSPHVIEKRSKTEEAILFLNFSSRSMVAASCFGSLSTLLYSSALKWH